MSDTRVNSTTLNSEEYPAMAMDANGNFVVAASPSSSDASLNAVALESFLSNASPLLAVPLADQTAAEGTAVSFTIPAGSFTDPDNDALTLSATRTSGAALPSWLTFNPATRSFSGTPPFDASGSLTIRVTATDGGGSTASDDFTLSIANSNTTFALTTEQRKQLQALRDTFPSVDALTYSQNLNYYEMYKLVFSYIEAWETAGNRLTEADTVTKVWLQGVIGVNQGVGAQSDFIRNYNSMQKELRFGGAPLTTAQLDKASDEIALKVIDDILRDSILPGINILAGTDVAIVATKLLNNSASAWAGNPLLLFLGYDAAFNKNILHADGDTYDLLAMMQVSRSTAGGYLAFYGDNFDTNLELLFGAAVTALRARAFGTVTNAYSAANAYILSAYGQNLLDVGYEVAFGDLILGRSGDDDGLSGSSASFLGFSFDELIHAGDGDDRILATYGDDIMDGGRGIDTVDYSQLSNDIRADLFKHTASINQRITDDLQRIYNIENVTGGSGNDTLIGDDANNMLTGGTGNDNLNGGEAGDSFQGLQPLGADDDILNGGRGDDRLEGGAGNDTYLFVTGDGVDRILDADRAGSIVVNGTTLAGQASYVSSNQLTLVAGGSSYTLSYFDDMQTLAIVRSGQSADTILVEGFDKAAGGLGVTLEDTDYVPPSQGLSFFADSGTPAPVTWLGSPGNDGFYTWVSATVYAGDGNDRFGTSHTAGYALVYGGAGDDYLSSRRDNATLYGGAGNDLLEIIGNSYADGGDGDDYIASRHIGKFLFQNLSFVDGEYPESTRQALIGGAGIDTLEVVNVSQVQETHVDLATGTLRHEFNATFYRPESDGSITGRNSYVRAVTTQFQIIDFENVMINYTLTGKKTIIGDNGNNDLTATGSGLDTSLFGGEGNDKVTLGTSGKGVADGGSGDDILNLGQGGEVVAFGGSGDDTLNISVGGEVTADGGAGNDTFTIKAAYRLSSEVRPNNIIGGAGYDTVSLLDDYYYYVERRTLFFGQIVITEAEELSIRGTRISGVATYDEWNNTYRLGSVTLNRDSSGLTVTASAYPEISVLLADWSSSNNYGITVPAGISGTGGADVLTGTGGNDRLDGGAGADSLLGDAGNDSLDGGSDTDWLNFAAATQAVTVDLQNGSATGFFGTDRLTSIEAALGGNSADSLRGDAGSNTLHGGAGADTMAGGAGNDLFFVTDAGDLVMELAGSGADTIIASTTMAMPNHVETVLIAAGVSGITITGGAGNDKLIGNGLANTFIGGAGDDVILAGNLTLADIHALFAI